MKIISYKHESDTWTFDLAKLKRVNLIVGDSGSGKSRFINTISNLFNIVKQDILLGDGYWEITVKIHELYYKWNIKTIHSSKDNQPEIETEELSYGESLDSLKTYIRRNGSNIVFDDKVLPKLASNISILKLFKDENDVKIIYDALNQVITRRFSADELVKNFSIFDISGNALNEIEKNKHLNDVYVKDIGFNNKIYLLSKIDKLKYEELLEYFIDVFPFITEFQIMDQLLNTNTGNVKSKVLVFKEKSVNVWIPVNDISSGMQKVFLLALDIFLMEKGGILIIDEYENSLGVSALNTLPELIEDTSSECQFILTSHHPYIINNISEENWLGFTRIGNHVSIKHGNDFSKQFKSSTQDSFVQLLNDITYNNGIS